MFMEVVLAPSKWLTTSSTNLLSGPRFCEISVPPHISPTVGDTGHLKNHINSIVDADCREGVLMYCVRWLPHDEDEDTWETRET
jgi:hypothetical protein